MIDTPPALKYASVVSRQSVCIALTIAALNDLQMKVGDIQNAYLTAPCAEKIWKICRPEFEVNQDRKAIIVKALYGLTSAGASFRKHLADCMEHVGYMSCKANPDVWIKSETEPSTGFQYYSYVLIYVNDILAIHHDAMWCLNAIDKYFTIKPESMGDPDLYLGAKLRKVWMNNGVDAWAMSPAKYVKEAVNVIKQCLESKGDKLLKKVASPFPTGYWPERDNSEMLDAEDTTYFQSQIGILRWMVELELI